MCFPIFRANSFSCRSRSRGNYNNSYIITQLLKSTSNCSYVNEFPKKNISVRSRFDRALQQVKPKILPRPENFLSTVNRIFISFGQVLCNLWRWNSTTRFLKAITTNQHMAHSKRILNSLSYLPECLHFCVQSSLGLNRTISTFRDKGDSVPFQELALKSFRTNGKKWR